jgi:hypothetical protein
MKNKLRPLERKVINFYIIFLVLVMLCAIYLSSKIIIFEVTNWDSTIFKQTYFYTIPVVVLITLFLTKLIVLPKNKEDSNSMRSKGFKLGFLIAIFINFMIVQSSVHLFAKFYNIYGPSQKEIIIEGDVVKVYRKHTIKKRNRRKQYVTIFEKKLNKSIKFEIRKPFTSNTYFNETMMQGSLGYLYKLK